MMNIHRKCMEKVTPECRDISDFKSEDLGELSVRFVNGYSNATESHICLNGFYFKK